MSAPEIFKTVLFLYLLVGFVVASFGTQAILLAAHTIKREDGVRFLTPEDLILLYFRFLLLWGWHYFLSPALRRTIINQWERAWRIY